MAALVQMAGSWTASLGASQRSVAGGAIRVQAQRCAGLRPPDSIPVGGASRRTCPAATSCGGRGARDRPPDGRLTGAVVGGTYCRRRCHCIAEGLARTTAEPAGALVAASARRRAHRPRDHRLARARSRPSRRRSSRKPAECASEVGPLGGVAQGVEQCPGHRGRAGVGGPSGSSHRLLRPDPILPAASGQHAVSVDGRGRVARSICGRDHLGRCRTCTPTDPAGAQRLGAGLSRRRMCDRQSD